MMRTLWLTSVDSYIKHCQSPCDSQHLAVSSYHLSPFCLPLVHWAGVGTALIKGYQSKGTDYILESSAGSRDGGGGNFSSVRFVWGKGNRSFFLKKCIFKECVLSLQHCPKHLICIMLSFLSVLYPQCLRLCLAHPKRLLSICWMHR